MREGAYGLAYSVSYQGSDGSARWEGRTVSDVDQFRSFMHGTVRARVRDSEAEAPFAAELRALATTGMMTEFLEKLLRWRLPPGSKSSLGTFRSRSPIGPTYWLEGLHDVVWLDLRQPRI